MGGDARVHPLIHNFSPPDPQLVRANSEIFARKSSSHDFFKTLDSTTDCAKVHALFSSNHLCRFEPEFKRKITQFRWEISNQAA